MYKVLIKIDGEYLYMLEAFENGSMDIVSLLVIIYCISIAYRKKIFINRVFICKGAIKPVKCVLYGFCNSNVYILLFRRKIFITIVNI
mgnify:CR=1 FL=1